MKPTVPALALALVLAVAHSSPAQIEDLEQTRAAAEAGDPEAQYNLAVLYRYAVTVRGVEFSKEAPPVPKLVTAGRRKGQPRRPAGPWPYLRARRAHSTEPQRGRQVVHPRSRAREPARPVAAWPFPLRGVRRSTQALPEGPVLAGTLRPPRFRPGSRPPWLDVLHRRGRRKRSRESVHLDEFGRLRWGPGILWVEGQGKNPNDRRRTHPSPTAGRPALAEHQAPQLSIRKSNRGPCIGADPAQNLGPFTEERASVC